MKENQEIEKEFRKVVRYFGGIGFSKGYVGVEAIGEVLGEGNECLMLCIWESKVSYVEEFRNSIIYKQNFQS